MNARLSILCFTVIGLAMAQKTPQPASAPAPPATTSKAPDHAPSEMKTSTFRGLLVDMACARSSGGEMASGGGAASSAPAKSGASDSSNSANRAAGDSGGSCQVTAGSTEMGMKMDDGKIVRFDLVGNQRAQDALKNDKRWTKEIGENKPIRAKVNGVLMGDKLIVSSIQ